MGHSQHSTAPQVFLYHHRQTYAEALQHDPATLATHLRAPALPSAAVKLDHSPFCLRSCCILNRTSLYPQLQILKNLIQAPVSGFVAAVSL